MKNIDLTDFLHPENKYPEYTTYIKKLDDVLYNIPIVPQFFRYYELISDKIIKEDETFHEPYKKGMVSINQDYEVHEGIHKQLNEINEIQNEYEKELIETIGVRKYELYNNCLDEWYTPGKRDKSEIVKQLKKSISLYLGNGTIYVDEELDETIQPNFEKQEIKALLDIQQKYLKELFENNLFYDEENDNFSDYALFRGLNVEDLEKLFLDPHKELKFLSSYSCSPEVAVGLANKGYDNKVLLFDYIENFENRIIASCLLNKIFNNSINQNEFLIIPNTKLRKMDFISKVEDLNIYQIHDIGAPLINNDLREERRDAQFPLDSVHEVRDFFNNNTQLIFGYKNNTIVINKIINSYQLEIINEICETRFLDFNSITNLLESKLFEGKSIIEIYCLTE